jgi:hypothetical protein
VPLAPFAPSPALITQSTNRNPGDWYMTTATLLRPAPPSSVPVALGETRLNRSNVVDRITPSAMTAGLPVITVSSPALRLAKASVNPP